MSVAWSVFEPRLQRALKSLDDSEYSTELRLDAINAAQRALSSHTTKQVFKQITGDGAAKSWAIPADADSPKYYPLDTPDWCEAIWDDADKTWLEPIRFYPGSEWSAATPPGFYMWPPGTLNLTYAPTGKINVYYYAYWRPIDAVGTVGGNFTVEAPDWSWTALIHYACAYAVAPGGLSAARIRQFNTTVDSGNPEHNPVHDQARFHLEQYDAELRRWPAQARGMAFSPGRAL